MSLSEKRRSKKPKEKPCFSRLSAFSFEGRILLSFFIFTFIEELIHQLMTEAFYDMSHLSTDELRELFTSYRKLGWMDYESEILDEDNSPIQSLSDAEIILNIQAGNEKNYFVFMLDHEDEKDGVMIGFGLTYHEDFSVYLHLSPKYLKELIEKYALVSKATAAQKLTVEEYLVMLANNNTSLN
jgi:hypothetical protein